MLDVFNTAFTQAMQSSWLELVAVVLGVAYLLLAMRESVYCWYAAFDSTSIFLWIFWEVNLYMESGLQVYYLAMAVYGWNQWRTGTQTDDTLPIRCWRTSTHLLVISATILLSFASGYALNTFTDAELPYLDSFTTWGAIVTTYMVANKILENWVYWFVIDAISIYLYLDRELYFTALLFTAYVVIVVFGYKSWLKSYRVQTQNSVPQ